MTLEHRVMLYGAAGIVALLALNWMMRGRIMQEAAAAVPRIVGDTGSGVVLGVGDAVGLPRVNETECDRALAEKRWWDASFTCPAGRFISGVLKPEGTAENPINRVPIHPYEVLILPGP